LRYQTRTLLMCLPAVGMAVLLLLKHGQILFTQALATLDLFWGYIEAGLLVAVVVGAVFLRPRWPALLIVLLLGADLSLAWIRDATANSGPATGPRLKVITFNWLADTRDRSEIFRWIETEKPDILAIQEFSELEAGIASGLYPLFPFQGRPQRDVVILSRYPIVQVKSRNVEEHAITRAVLDIAGRNLTVWGIHPATLREPLELSARNYYLTSIAEMLHETSEPVLMLGDFNATRWDPYFASVVARGKLHEEARLFPIPTRMGVRSGLPFIGAPIDHILTNAGNVLSNCHTGPALGSDHLPLICDLQLEH
jgi:endonuclease/exonuclease/phosphatase (EEP) superfamily protein YafD